MTNIIRMTKFQICGGLPECDKPEYTLLHNVIVFSFSFFL